MIPEGHYFAPAPGVWNLSVFYGGDSSRKETSLRLLKVITGTDPVILLRAFPETAPAVGLGDPDYHGISMRYDYLKVEDGDVLQRPPGGPGPVQRPCGRCSAEKVA